MLRKASIISIIGLLTSSCFAQGLYIGLGGGLEGADFTQDATIKKPKAFDVIDKQHQAGDGVFGSIFGGYGLNYRCFYLGAEANLNSSTVEFESSNDEFINKNFSQTFYKIRRSYGLSLLPGLILSNSTLLYARVGHSVGRLEISTTDKSLHNENKLLDGTRLGFGIKQTFYHQFSFIIDFSHISYQHVRLFTFDRESEVSKATKIRPETAQIQVGVVYNFC